MLPIDFILMWVAATVTLIGIYSMKMIQESSELTQRELNKIEERQEMRRLSCYPAPQVSQMIIAAPIALKLEPAIQQPLQLEPGDKILCNVCGAQITEDIVYCDSCKTPHHRKCWEYNGKCATYACGCETYHAEIPSNPYWGEEPD